MSKDIDKPVGEYEDLGTQQKNKNSNNGLCGTLK